MIVDALFALAGAVRVFSADYCADQLVLALADPGQIAALSVDAEKDFSYLRANAEGLPQARADAEQVIARNPDIVIRYWGGDAARLQRLGVTVVTLDYAADFEAVKANVLIAAKAMGQQRRGELLVREIAARLLALSSRGRLSIAGLYVTPGGVTAGKGTMIDAIFTAAGVGNVEAERGLSYWPPLSAEALVANPPRFIVTGFFSANSERVNHWSAARHPALRNVIERTPNVGLAADVLACPNWFSLDAAEAVRNAAEKLND